MIERRRRNKVEICAMAPMIIKSVLSYTITDFASSYCYFGKIPNVATEKEPKKSFLYLTDVTLVVADIQL